MITSSSRSPTITLLPPRTCLATDTNRLLLLLVCSTTLYVETALAPVSDHAHAPFADHPPHHDHLFFQVPHDHIASAENVSRHRHQSPSPAARSLHYTICRYGPCAHLGPRSRPFRRPPTSP